MHEISERRKKKEIRYISRVEIVREVERFVDKYRVNVNK